RERVEAGGGAARDALIAAAQRTEENLRAPVLVEQDGARRERLGLGRQKVQHHRLARAGRTDDGEIAEIALVEVEEERRRARRFEDGDRLAPVVAGRAAHREAVERDEACRVGARDQGTADDIWAIARDL